MNIIDELKYMIHGDRKATIPKKMILNGNQRTYEILNEMQFKMIVGAYIIDEYFDGELKISIDTINKFKTCFVGIERVEKPGMKFKVFTTKDKIDGNMFSLLVSLAGGSVKINLKDLEKYEHFKIEQSEDSGDIITKIVED